MKKTKAKNKYEIFFLLIILFSSFFVVRGVHAQLVPCGIGEGNADCTLCHLVIGFQNIYTYLLELLFVATTVTIVAAGIVYMVSSGSKALVEKAKSILVYALTAIILALTAWLIINATLNALGYKNAGNWWTFTCDTTQTKSNGNLSTGVTLPGVGGSQGAAVGSQTNIAKGDGTCGGIAVAQNSDQCNYTSAQLDTVLKCINSRMALADLKNNLARGKIPGIPTANAAGGVTVSSLGQNQNGGNWQGCVGANWNAANCPHAQNSCHYGGTNCQEQINAADLTGDMGKAAQAARDCGADTVIYNNTAYFGGQSKAASDHTDHVHISVNNKACGCDYLK
jgi:hypothetical protein